MFLHGGIFHLAFNMWFLWLFGDNLEDKLGKIAFVVFYLLGGICASLLHSFVANDFMRNIPCIGASGAISAVMGGYLFLFPQARVRVFIWVFVFAVRIKLSAFVFLGIWFLEQLLLGSVSVAGGQATEVAYWAHIGGFFFGVVFVFLLKTYVFSEKHLLTTEERKVKEIEDKFHDSIGTATKEEKAKQESFSDYKQAIEKYLEEGKIDSAIEKYKIFENKSISGALEPKAQKLIADTLLKGNEKLLAWQAYLRFMINYPDNKQAATINCRLGLLSSRDFKNPFEGVKHLREGLRNLEEVSDQNLLSEASKELKKINSLLEKTFIQTKDEGASGSKFVILAKLIDEKLVDKERIFNILFSIGTIQKKNIGLKLAYNAEHNLKIKDGVILKNLNIIEAVLATYKLQSRGVPAIALREEELVKYPLINRVTGASIAAGNFTFRTEAGKDFSINPSQILYITLGQIPYYIYRKDHLGGKPGVFNIGGGQEDIEAKVDDIGVNRLLDIFTINSLRFRISSLGFNYKEKEGATINKEEFFELFIEDLASIVGGSKIDEKVKAFISNNDWKGLNFKSIKEFNEKALWAVRLKNVYDHLLEHEKKDS